MEKIKKIIPLLFIILGISSHYFFFNVTSLNFYLIFFRPLYIYSLYSLPIALALLFVTPRMFKAWLRVAIPWLLLSVVVVAIMPQYGGILQPSKIDVARFMGVGFSVIGLLTLAVLFLHCRKKKNTDHT